jgi:hypothetical protein
MNKSNSTFFALVFVFVAFICIFLGLNMSKVDIAKRENTNSIKGINDKVISSFDDLTSDELWYFEEASHNHFEVLGENSTKYTYQDNSDEIYRYILATKDKSNYLYVVQKVLFVNYFNKSEQVTVFIPVRFKDVLSELRDVDDEFNRLVEESIVDAPKFYLNSEKTSYLKGYANYDEFVNDKIDELKDKGYKISEK